MKSDISIVVRRGEGMRESIWKLLFVICFIFLFSFWQTEQVQAESKPTKLYTGEEDYVLEGLIDQKQFYYDIPTEKISGNNNFVLHIRYSDLLLKDSTVTIALDGEPVKSVTINPKKTEMEIDVPLRGEMLERGFHQVTVSFYGELAAEMCTNEENPANWMTILADSHFNLHVDKDLKDRDNMLVDYPYPFVQMDGSDASSTVIVLPDDASEKVMSAALKLTGYINSQTGEQESVDIMFESDVEKQVNKLDAHMIVIGEVDTFSSIVDGMIQTAEADVKKDHLLVKNEIISLPKGDRQVMFVLANDGETLSSLIPIITTDAYVDQLTGNEMEIKQLPTLPGQDRKDKVDFNSLSIPSMTLSGLESSSPYYFYDVPTYVDRKETSYLHLKLEVAETLRHESLASQRSGELVVMVNDVPHSVDLNELEEDSDGFFRLALPISSETIQQGDTMSIQFVGHGLKERDICVLPTDERWIYIDEASYIEFALKEDGTNEADFSSWPQPFISSEEGTNTLVVVPEKIDREMLKQTQIVMNELVTKNNMASMELVHTDNVTKEQLKDHHIIFIGDVRKWEALNDAESTLLQVDEEGVVNVYEHGFVAEGAKLVTSIQDSIWNDKHSLVIFTSVHPEEKEFVSSDIVHALSNEKLFANIVVETANTDIFSNEVALKDGSDIGKAPSEKSTEEPWMLFIFVGMFVIGLLIFIAVVRNRRKAMKE